MAPTKPRKTRVQWTYPAVHGQRLRDARQDLCLTLAEVCEACAALDPLASFVTSNLSRYERGEGNPSPKRLRVLAQVLGKTPDDFLVQPRKERIAA
jgi:transcriptional regulator with XRE-family HTH domain